MADDIVTLPNLPAYLAGETVDVVLARMLAPIKAAGYDASPGSMAYIILTPAALEVAQAKGDFRKGLLKAFARYTSGAYMDHLGEQRAGVFRIVAVAARTLIRFTGTAGTPVPASTQVCTQLPPGATAAAVVFKSLAPAVIPSGGFVDTLCECTVAGIVGNVAQGALKVLITPVSGVTAVSNPYAVGTGTGDTLGADVEPDAPFLELYLQAVANPAGSGSKSDYQRWALEVAGVGGVYVQPIAYGPSTVRVVLSGADKLPASTAVVQAVEDHLFAPRRLTRQAETMTRIGNGTSVDTTLTDDTVDSVKLIYDVTLVGQISDRLDLIPLPQEGIWTAYPLVKVNVNTGTPDLLQIGVWNLSAAAWATVAPSGTTQSLLTKKGTGLATTFTEVPLDYYWNGRDQLELRIIRLQTDTTTTVWVDQVRHRSAFQQDTATPKAPCTDRIYTEPAGQVTANIAYHPVYAAGTDPATVDAAVLANIRTYLQEMPLGTSGTIWYVRISAAILATPGMTSHTGLLVNGATGDLSKSIDQVAALGTVTKT